MARPATRRAKKPADPPAARCPFVRGDRFRERVTGQTGTVVGAINEHGVTITFDHWSTLARPPYGGAMPYCVGLLERIQQP